MNLLKHYIAGIIGFCVLSGAMAQTQNVAFTKANFKDNVAEFKVALKHKQQGDFHFYQKVYSKALEEYLAAHRFNSNNSELNARIGECYMYSSQKEKSMSYLLRALELDKDIDGYYVFLLGKSFHMLNQFEEAVGYYEKARSIGSKIKPEVPEMSQKKINECNVGDRLVLRPVNVEVHDLGEQINTENQEYVPVINADQSEMFFTSRRPGSVGGEKDPYLADYFEDIYHTYKENGEWKPAKNIGAPINSKRHDATVGLSVDGNKLFLYRDNEKGIGNVYISERKGLTWSEPEPMPAPINSKNKETSACFDHTGKVIYFVSNRKGGQGGKDIYKATKADDGTWGNVENLGPVINTEYDEDAVFMHADGKTLYFSSQGHETMGGYDIFKSTLEKGIWSTPKNVGFPINSPDDDVCFVVSANGERGYYTSNRVQGKGKRDIYSITFLDVIKENNRPKLTLYKGIVKDKESGKPLSATIEVYDNATGELMASYESNSATGKYMISLPSGHDYGINVASKGYLFYSENFQLPETKVYQEVEKDIELERLEVGKKVVLNNIFYDYNESTLRASSNTELNKVIRLLRDNPNIKMEMSAHTDSRGSDSYNEKLSQKRAQSCVDYLTRNGIPESRLVAKGYGEKVPIVTEAEIERLATEELQEESHQLNRRTEFKIIEN